MALAKSSRGFGGANGVLIISAAIEQHGKARVIVATGNSQIPMMQELVRTPVKWSRVKVFHMDEYAWISADHPSSFRYWVRTRLEESTAGQSVLHRRRCTI
jgi:glucosamine-6-phosphate deaminase